MLSQNYIKNLNRNMGNLNTFQTQAATGRRITKLSDDPVGAISSLGIRTKLNRLEQYTDNIEDAKSWLTQSESSVMEVNEVIQNIYEQSVRVSNDTLNDSDRNAVSLNIKQMREQLIQIGNTTFGNKYIFGGYNTSKTPFEEVGGNVLYNGVDLSSADPATLSGFQSQSIQYEIGTGIMTKASITGVDLFGSGSDNLFTIVDGLINEIDNKGSSAAISAYTGKLQDKQEDVLAQTAEIGGRQNRLQLVTSRYEKDKLNYQKVKSNVEDIDTAEVIMKLKLSEASYETALSVGSYIIQKSLADYLR